MITGDAWAMLFDRLDRLDRTIGNVDDRLRCVELDVREVRTQQDAARSRVSRETKAATDADQSLSARVEALEKVVQTNDGERKGFSKAAVILALVAAGGTGAGVESILKAIAGA